MSIIILKNKMLVYFDRTHSSHPLVLENQNVNIYYQWVSSSTGAWESRCQYQLSVSIIILKILMLVSFDPTHLSHPLVLENKNVNITISLYYFLENWNVSDFWLHPFKSSTGAWESKCQYQLSVCIIILKILNASVLWYQPF